MASRTLQIGGLYSSLAARDGTVSGSFAVHRSRSGRADGLHLVLDARSAQSAGSSRVLLARADAPAGRYRVEDTDIAVYEAYKGDDAEADPTGTPWATADSLPMTTPALSAAPAGNTMTYHILVVKRNAWNLRSENIAQYTITLDDTGAVVTPPPSAPVEIRVTQAQGGKARVRAAYFYDQDGTDRATQWAIYTKVGSDPDPSSDSPTLESIEIGDGVARLDTETSAYSDGADLRVLVCTKRDSAISENRTAQQITIETDGPATPDARLSLD